MKRDLHGCRVLLTGASSGIGHALAEQLAQSGARLVLAARSMEKLQALATSLTSRGTEAAAVAADVTSDSDRHAALEFAQRRLGWQCQQPRHHSRQAQLVRPRCQRDLQVLIRSRITNPFRPAGRADRHKHSGRKTLQDVINLYSCFKLFP